MAWFQRKREATPSAPALVVSELNVFYGRAHALQNISLTLDRGVLAVVGRNGMGKTSLCNAITGLIPALGSIRVYGQEIRGLTPNKITDLGIGYVPQGRRVWPSLSVHEHLNLAAKSARSGEWTVDRIYQTFPRLAERKGNGGAQLSGGEQQMLAIGRALLFNPSLLVMDEPTEGLAPVIVEQVAGMLRDIAASGEISILLIEQNLGVAIDVADNVAVMMNGQIARILPARELAADKDLQTRLLGIRQSEDETLAPNMDPDAQIEAGNEAENSVRVFRVRRAESPDHSPSLDDANTAVAGFNRWNSAAAEVRRKDISRQLETKAEKMIQIAPQVRALASVSELPVAQMVRKAAYIVGTFDTKSRELLFLQSCIERIGLRTVTVDLGTGGGSSTASVSPQEVARFHPDGARAVFSADRGAAVSAMTLAFERFIASRKDIGGIISAGGSGGTALATAGMRALPIGVPKLMVSTVASGDVRPYVGPSDICMMYSVTDVQGINRISEKVLSNAAHALAGMVAHEREVMKDAKPAIGLTMFGVTTQCVQAVTKQLESRYDCLVFHATGTGGQSMEKLVESGMLSAVLDITTTEIPDEIVGGVLSAGSTRMDVFSRLKVPYIGSCGALDIVNFWAKETIPQKFRDRNLYVHNPNVTLMRSTRNECEEIGRFIVAKLNQMSGPVRFFIPELGMSALDARGKPFHDPEADQALFSVIERDFRVGSDRKLIKLKYHLNDPEFADALVREFHSVMSTQPKQRFA
jgi:uncharacterized protein (UPF0261 family)/ABC-type branched-subunit amino acid transport system ATPase component